MLLEEILPRGGGGTRAIDPKGRNARVEIEIEKISLARSPAFPNGHSQLPTRTCCSPLPVTIR